MDRRYRLSITLAALAATVATVATVASGCSGAATTAVRLPAGARVLARGSLAYAARPDPGGVVTVELEERFALVIRDPHSGRERRRVDLGPPERDVLALAVGGGRAWVGGDDRQVRAIELATGRAVSTWPIGADVTALRWLPGGGAGGDGWLAIGDAAGVVCLRRVDDGALVQCAALATGPVTGLERGGGLTVVAAGTRTTWTVPALAPTAAAPAPRWRGRPVEVVGRELVTGGQVVARLGERIRTVEVGPAGELIIAAWVTRLDDPSVVTLPR